MALTPPEPPLGDEVVVLRPWTEQDVPTLVAACADPEIPRWIPLIPSPYTEADAHAFVAESEGRWREGSGGNFAIADRATRKAVGSIGVHLHPEDAGRAATGYWLAREARGRGYATRALRLVARWALETVGVERLELIAEPANTASCAVAERAGFRREGILRAYLETRTGRRDVAMYSLLPGEL